ncbi:MAG: energy-coupling factor transporter transmembrane component T [Tissierellia bacterium]|nr:energy-coupling factor transporter transmembrane component T [Tissierellia bacterium]
MNPLWKSIALLLISLIATFDYKPFLATVLVLIAVAITLFFTRQKLSEFGFFLAPFLIIGGGYVFIILLTRYLSGENIQLINTLSIATRMILVAAYSYLFVKTTKPEELVLTLITYFRMPVSWGYGFLSAYRFLPNFKNELEIIQYAHKVRGIEVGNNILTRITKARIYLIPLLTTAIRKGVRVTIAMETKGFGKFESRTTFRPLQITRRDLLSFTTFLCIIVFVIVVMTALDLTQFRLLYTDT